MYRNASQQKKRPIQFRGYDRCDKSLGIELRQATIKPAQFSMISTREKRTMGHQFVPAVTLNFISSYYTEYTALRCESSRGFHVRISYDVMNLKFGTHQYLQLKSARAPVEDILQTTRQIYDV